MRIAIILLATVKLLAAPAAALAGGGLSVSPVNIEFDGRGMARALDVSNPGNAATDVQVRLYAWTAVDGEDQLTPSTDLGFSPPMFRLTPGGHQVVRFVLTAPPADTERAYRVFVDQVPGNPEPGTLQMPVRMVLPLFVQPSGAVRVVQTSAAALRWQASYDPARKRLRLVARNSSGRRVKVQNLAYETGGKTIIAVPGLAGYVLAGRERAWDFDYAGPLAPLTVKADTDQGPIAAPALIASG